MQVLVLGLVASSPKVMTCFGRRIGLRTFVETNMVLGPKTDHKTFDEKASSSIDYRMTIIDSCIADKTSWKINQIIVCL